MSLTDGVIFINELVFICDEVSWCQAVSTGLYNVVCTLSNYSSVLSLNNWFAVSWTTSRTLLTMWYADCKTQQLKCLLHQIFRDSRKLPYTSGHSWTVPKNLCFYGSVINSRLGSHFAQKRNQYGVQYVCCISQLVVKWLNPMHLM